MLVATSIGEEGLDIGSVDLVINYDHPKSMTRNVQRKGRTGRKHNGKIIYIMTPSEKASFESALEKQEKDANFINKLIVDNPQARRKVWRDNIGHEPPTWPALFPGKLPQPKMVKFQNPFFNYAEEEARRRKTPKKRKKGKASKFFHQ